MTDEQREQVEDADLDVEDVEGEELPAREQMSVVTPSPDYPPPPMAD